MKIAAILLLLFACGAQPERAATPGPLPDCEGCGASEAPKQLSWRARIPIEGEPGEPLVVTGRVLRDGKPVPHVLLYAYHTNAQGIYPKRGDETGNGRRHGYLRTWLRTGADGRYEITTIRPGGYPGRPDPAHIHMTVTEPGKPEAWIDSIEFSDDPRVTPAHRARQDNRGGSGIVTPARDANGVWRVQRDISL